MGKLEPLTLRDAPSSTGSIFNTALPAAESDWFATALDVPADGTMRVTVQVSVAGVLRTRITRSAATISGNLNSSFNLTASSLYAFDIPVKAGDTFNLRYSVTAGNIDYCEVQFIKGNV